MIRNVKTSAKLTGKKTCIICRKSKDTAEFYSYPYTTNQGKRSTRLESRCKPCARARRRDRTVSAGKKDAENCRLWRTRNKEHVSERNEAYRRSPHGRKLRAQSQLRRYHRSRSTDGSYTQADIDRILAYQKCKCGACRISILGSYTIDHIRPISRGGTNWPRNIQLLCLSCNCRKNNKTYEDWTASLGLLL